MKKSLSGLFDLPEGAATDEDTPLIIDAETLIANDSAANGDMLVVSAVEETSSNGASVTLNADGDIVMIQRPLWPFKY